MAHKIKLDDKEFEVDDSELSPDARAKLALIQYSTKREEELLNLKAILQKAKVGYLESLKREILASKSGFLFDSQ